MTDKRIKTNYNDYNKELIANNLRTLRNNKNSSRQQLAMKLGVTQSCIHRYENALSNPSLPIVYKYTKIFNILFNDLCSKSLKNNIYNHIFYKFIFDQKTTHGFL